MQVFRFQFWVVCASLLLYYFSSIIFSIRGFRGQIHFLLHVQHCMSKWGFWILCIRYDLFFEHETKWKMDIALKQCAILGQKKLPKTLLYLKYFQDVGVKKIGLFLCYHQISSTYRYDRSKKGDKSVYKITFTFLWKLARSFHNHRSICLLTSLGLNFRCVGEKKPFSIFFAASDVERSKLPHRTNCRSGLLQYFILWQRKSDMTSTASTMRMYIVL